MIKYSPRVDEDHVIGSFLPTVTLVCRTAVIIGTMKAELLELHTDSVFQYESFGIFSVFSYRIPKGNSVGKFGILKLAGAPFSQRKGGLWPPFVHFAPLLRNKRSSRHHNKKYYLLTNHWWWSGWWYCKEAMWEWTLSTTPWNRIQDENEKRWIKGLQLSFVLVEIISWPIHESRKACHQVSCCPCNICSIWAYLESSNKSPHCQEK